MYLKMIPHQMKHNHDFSCNVKVPPVKVSSILYQFNVHVAKKDTSNTKYHGILH